MTELKVTRKLQVDDVWLWRGRRVRIIAIHTCPQTGVSHLETKESLRGDYWGDAGFREVSTFMCGCEMRLGKFVTTERKFLGIRLPPKIAFVAEP